MTTDDRRWAYSHSTEGDESWDYADDRADAVRRAVEWYDDAHGPLDVGESARIVIGRAGVTTHARIAEMVFADLSEQMSAAYYEESENSEESYPNASSEVMDAIAKELRECLLSALAKHRVPPPSWFTAEDEEYLTVTLMRYDGETPVYVETPRRPWGSK